MRTYFLGLMLIFEFNSYLLKSCYLIYTLIVVYLIYLLFDILFYNPAMNLLQKTFKKLFILFMFSLTIHFRRAT